MSDSVRLKWLLSESDVRAGVEAEALPLLSVSISWGVRRRETAGTTTRAAAEDLSNYKVCRAGDLVINRMRAFQGALGIAPEDGIVSPDYAVLGVDSSIDSRWLNYFLTSGSTVATMASLVRGIGGTEAGNVRTPRLNIADLLSIVAPLVSAEEQRVIADYLDRETARIDTLIEEQQRLIEMLRERRLALRVNVALHGTAPAEEVESPLPWAKTLPAAWRVVPLTSVAALESGHTPSRSREDWWRDCYIPWVSLHDVGMMRGVKYLHDTTQHISDAGISNSSARLLPARTVVLSRDATVGRTAIMGVPMATSQHFAAWVCGPDLDPEYLWVLFGDAMQPFFDSFQNGSTIRTIGMGDLKAFRIPLPPLDEQRRIVEYLDEETAKIDSLIAETERFVQLSKERRSALITAAVTGQIDVREVA
ncbi:restriction endonuclease subunit S [Streptomyces sp. NPDC047453]|uniref:restriction endonuclease subunit S n=1 Tax=Streptomyces sp. NPDC047453 TaxID=3154812 RepID=UPI0033CE7A28